MTYDRFTRNVLLLSAMCAFASPAFGQDPQTSDGYPSGWEVRVPPGSRLAAIKRDFETRKVAIVGRDLEDRSPLPFWFRAFLRAQMPELPVRGPYQYPRVSMQILEWMASHPQLTVAPPSRLRTRVRGSKTVRVGQNINLTALDEVNSESFIALDFSNPQFVIAASNNISGSGRLKQFFSADGGTTWRSTELPLAPGKAFHSDPALAFTTDGTAWSATLAINENGSAIDIQVYKSTDHGATWTFSATVSTGTNNDKEMLLADTHPTSPHKDNLYVVWDVPGGGMRLARSTNQGATWSSPLTLSTDQAIGAHLASGPDGELYVAWPDTASRELRLRKSTDGGATFGPVSVIATTNDAYEVSLPAMCRRKVLIYLSLGVDRSTGPRKGTVYATWTDRNGADPDPGCSGAAIPANANVYFSSSSNGGQTWSDRKVVHPDDASVDQFNQWMDVDPHDGSVHVVFYDTRNDAARKKTDLFYVTSRDGGATWVDEKKVTTAQSDVSGDEADPNQYGDYGGLVVFRGVAHASWTDRRAGSPGGKEQIYTGAIRKKPAP